MVSIDTEEARLNKEKSRIETKEEVIAFLSNLKYVINKGAQIKVQLDRHNDQNRPIENTNRYTIADLFPDESPDVALKRELLKLTVQEYLRTVKDIRFPNKSEMREFGKVYNGSKEVYIKIRVEILGEAGQPPLFVMSFHYAITPFEQEVFPYKD